MSLKSSLQRWIYSREIFYHFNSSYTLCSTLQTKTLLKEKATTGDFHGKYQKYGITFGDVRSVILCQNFNRYMTLKNTSPACSNIK